ncbi:bifunctional MaoC family dehydratase N-terminal/OB-fold nucleic acid binding domain-containing protein [Streptomyces sp. NPDC058953]|uniref:bifunctional MaoC family dehydratase N-terminal/OB-fold nucleic acid binding domain-containing protein n=1 Tax=unclassified Streptomyces TaxID=2593676 RepID=UPI00369D9A79
MSGEAVTTVAERSDRAGDPVAVLSARLKEYEGCAAMVGAVGKDPVNAPMIRHWCEAVGDTHPAYRGPDAVAPPAMLQVWTMGGLSGHAGTGAGSGAGSDGGGVTPAREELFGLLDAAGYTSVVATDCEQEYLRPLRPGDRITFDTVIESVSERKETKLGTGFFITTRMDVRADGEPAGVHRFRILKYAPPPRPSGSGVGTGAAGERRGAARPRPVVNRDNAGFWQGVAEHRLLIQRCAECGRLRFPWLPGCNDCGSDAWETVEADGSGSVYSYVVMHHPAFPAFDPPYAVGLIELREGVRIVAGVTGVPYDEIRIGLPVELDFLDVAESGGDGVVPVFRVVSTGEEAG